MMVLYIVYHTILLYYDTRRVGRYQSLIRIRKTK